MNTAPPEQARKTIQLITTYELKQLCKKENDCHLEFQNRLPQWVADDNPDVFICSNCHGRMSLYGEGGRCPTCNNFWDLPRIVRTQHGCNENQASNILAAERGYIISPTPDKDKHLSEFQQAYDFIYLITGHSDSPVVFQTVGDSEEFKGNQKLKRVIGGSFVEKANYINYLNNEGAGIFLTINETTGGRKKDDVTRIRAVWVDLDGSPLDPILGCNPQPHIIVESSPGKYHAYWLVNEVSVAEFSSIQTALAKKFNGDPAVKDPSRVMRLPGFFHRKKPDHPFMTRILRASGLPQYQGEEINQ